MEGRPSLFDQPCLDIGQWSANVGRAEVERDSQQRALVPIQAVIDGLDLRNMVVRPVHITQQFLLTLAQV